VVDTVWGALAEIRAGGVTILLVEQRAQITVEFADRTYVLGNGRIKMELTPRDAGNTDRMVEAYFGS
jgi:branched-chain amino acid transport system ATP-binding protein